MTQFNLSPKTQALIAKLNEQECSTIFKSKNVETLELKALYDWFDISTDETDEHLKLLIASLNNALLKDLAKSLPNYKKKQKPVKDKSRFDKIIRWCKKNLLYPFLIVAGIVVYSCDGFAGITSIVDIFPLSAPLLVVVGTAFAFITVLAFYVFNLSQIAKNLEITQKEARRLVDNYLKEVELINENRKLINADYIRRKDMMDLERDLQIIDLLIARYQALEKGREALARQKNNNNKLIMTKFVIESVIGLIYFSCGFFAGQALATALIGLIVTSTATIFWPIFAASCALGLVVGLVAVGVYWFVERPSIDKLVSSWFGLETDKIEQLVDSEKIERHTTKLEQLKINLKLRQNRILADSEKLHEYKTKLDLAKNKRRDLKNKGTQFNYSNSFGFFSNLFLTNNKPLTKTLSIREKTKTLIENFKNEKLTKIFKRDLNETIKRTKIIKWLHQAPDEQDENLQVEKARLNAALLKDLASSLQNPLPEKKQKEKNSRDLLYFFLTVAGVIFFGCDAFYGVTCIIAMFSIPNLAIFFVGLFFGILAIVAFLSFDLPEIAKDLGIKKKNEPQLVDLYLKEVEVIKTIRRNLDALYVERNTVEELEDDLELVDLIIARYSALDKERKKLTELAANKKLTILKYVIFTLIGIVYFGTSFFAGQIVCLAIAGLFIASVAPFSWPIILVSMVIGLSSLALYWFVERANLDKLISSLFGFDKDKIEKFCNVESVTEQKAKLDLLKTNISACKDYHQTLSNKEQEFEQALQKADKEIKELERNLSPTQGPDIFNKSTPTLTQENYFFNSKEEKANSFNENQQSALNI